FSGSHQPCRPSVVVEFNPPPAPFPHFLDALDIFPPPLAEGTLRLVWAPLIPLFTAAFAGGV
ncbi:MAG: hypothetical protein QF541_05790, partial [Lentisphaeria bacterium]|nr:hypothetical protein [Lentisphaeria bacterium]